MGWLTWPHDWPPITHGLTYLTSSLTLQNPWFDLPKKGHSCETALLRVQTDILLAMDKQRVVILVLLDSSAAFDTIDHNILLNRLSERIGIKGKALQWFSSYLSDRVQSVHVQGKSSRSMPLLHGVPQGSVLGPILFTIYTLPLGDIMRKHGVSCFMYMQMIPNYTCHLHQKTKK